LISSQLSFFSPGRRLASGAHAPPAGREER
jgi:hypothetical protein